MSEPALTCPFLAIDSSYRLKKKPVVDYQRGEPTVAVVFPTKQYPLVMSYDIGCQFRCHSRVTEVVTEMKEGGGSEEMKEGGGGEAPLHAPPSPIRGSRMSSQSDQCWYHVPPNLFTQDRDVAFDLSEDCCCTPSPIKPCYSARTLPLCTKYLALLPNFRTFFMKDDNGGFRQVRPIWFLVEEDETTDVGEAERRYHARAPSDEAPTLLAFATKADAHRQKARRQQDEMGQMRG
ncbi:hypothetical protein B0H11DRAFT_2238425 [Mycena galericulata]|nr:hypothetical protein B0H11DRAFT_2238425 [Mycena galericulata]